MQPMAALQPDTPCTTGLNPQAGGDHVRDCVPVAQNDTSSRSSLCPHTARRQT
ncbi:hypothetical protein LU699_03245 [Luteimonas fraxinea]|uniref:Uncharacterized protein n=1 Tax=Luteimonas fraxinea TaxID=2901869 RepID=A0ABS8U974_9GAMM|nr:hypothetical protein [Luteimonas fraxinea]MCD9096066.1 hypothetical protein [Luteimonas fraxinea]UHH10762.1 hypothetical protein LU699_03245 [Luteimonas fraxinea]